MAGDAGDDVDEVDACDAGTFDAMRVAAGWPLAGVDFAQGCIPAETGLIGVAVSFSKGCYPGQELVERMDSRKATPPRHLRVIERTPDMVVGSQVVRDGDVIGVRRRFVPTGSLPGGVALYATITVG